MKKLGYVSTKKKVYCILVDGQLSSEGYSTEEAAINYILNQPYDEINGQGWNFYAIDERGNQAHNYQITDVDII